MEVRSLNDQIEVGVVEFSDRKFYMFQWANPVTGRKRTRSSKAERSGRKRERVRVPHQVPNQRSLGPVGSLLRQLA